MSKNITKKIEVPIQLLMELAKRYIENLEGITLPNKGELIDLGGDGEATADSMLDDFLVRFEYPANYTGTKSEKAATQSTERKIDLTL